MSYTIPIELEPILLLAWTISGGSPSVSLALTVPLAAVYLSVMLGPWLGFFFCLPPIPLLFVAAAFGWREIFFGGTEGSA